MKISGIYQIVNIINNKIYIGSSSFLSLRKSVHFSLLKKNTHYNKHLQSSFNKYGIKNFIFEIIEECSLEQLIEKEQFYIDTLKPAYNKRLIAESNRGRKYTMSNLHKYKIGIKRRKLSNLDVNNIVKLRKEGLYMREIAEIYSISDGAISRILNGKFYKGVVNKEDFNNKKSYQWQNVV